MSKAQLVMTDFFIALMVFIILITAIIINLNNYTSRLSYDQNKNEILITLFQVSDAFVKTSGIPSSWESNLTSLEVIGLADWDRNLSVNKVKNFTNLNYTRAQSFLDYYNFYFRIMNSTNSSLVASGLVFNGTSSVSTRRYVNYNGNEVIMELTLWE